jgi:hypothetical protein
LRDLQARWESRLFDFSISRLFHGHGLLLSERRQELSGSAQESVDGSDFMGILGCGDFVYTG